MLSTVSGRGHSWVTLLRSGCLGMGLGACQIVPGFSLLSKIRLCREEAGSGDSACCPGADPGLRASRDSGPACLCL